MGNMSLFFVKRTHVGIIFCVQCCFFITLISADFDLMLLHTNDVHARFEETAIDGTPCQSAMSKSGKCYGGFPRIKQALNESIDEAERQNVPHIYLDGGDVFQGTAYYTLMKWPVVAEFINAMPIDVMSLGNHEFDDGVVHLAKYLRTINKPVVCANMIVGPEKDLDLPNLTKSVVLKVGKGEKQYSIGVIGYLLQNMNKTRVIGAVKFADEIESIRAEAKKLKSQNVKVIIALGHSGFHKDIEIAKEISEISLVVGAHSHTLLYTPKSKKPSTEDVIEEYPYMVTQESGRKVPVVQAFCNGKYLGKLRVKFNDNGDVISAIGNPKLLDASVKHDPKVLKMVNEHKEEILSITSQHVGQTTINLYRESARQLEESNIGNLIADAFVDYVQTNYNDTKEGWADAPASIVRGASIRSNFDISENDGLITYGDLLTILPYNSRICKVYAYGRSIRRVLETSARISPGLQFSGMIVEYDLRDPDKHDILRTVKIRCENCWAPHYTPLKDNRLYCILMTEYMMNGMFRKEKKKAKCLDISDIDATSSYIRNQRIVHPVVEGRIVIQKPGNTSATSAYRKRVGPVQVKSSCSADDSKKKR